jgi:uncharacterized membrane-anchored protein YhcB (DUF1043 family)
MQTTVCSATREHAQSLKALADRLNHHAKHIAEAAEILAMGKDFSICTLAVNEAIEQATADLSEAYGDPDEYAAMASGLTARA